MSVLEEVNNLALDMNRAIMALVFFLKSPPRVDTDTKFLDLARTATSDFRGLQCKVVEASEAFPDADTSMMSLELTIEAIQSYLVTTIKQMRVCLNEWLESQQTLSPGPSLDFLASATSEMHSLVDSVISSTKSIKKIITGEGLEPVKIVPLVAIEEALDIHPEDALAVHSLLQNPSPQQIDQFLGPPAPTDRDSTPQISFNATAHSNGPLDLSFESMLANAERQERKDQRKALQRNHAPTKQVAKRSSIEVDPETLDAIVLHLSELTAIFFTESNYFGQQPAHLTADDLVSMPELAGKHSLANDMALSLQTASIDMESFLNKNHQASLAKLTTLHMKDILSSMKDVFSTAPQVSWSTLHQLDVAIKDYATTIKDVVQLANPEYEEVYLDEEDHDSQSDSDDEPAPFTKATRKLTKEEEMLQAFDGFADALDALDIDLTGSTPSKTSDLLFGSPLSTNRSTLDSKNEEPPLFGPFSGNRSAPTHIGSYESGASSPNSFPSSLGHPLSWTGLDTTNGHYREGRSHTVAGASGDSTVIGSFQSTSSFLSSTSTHTTQTTLSGNSNPSSTSDSLPSTPRSDSRVTLQFPGVRPRSMISVSEKHSPMLSSSPQQDSAMEDKRAKLQATKSTSIIEATYEIADEAIRQADALKVLDRWSEMQARSEEQRTIPQDPTVSSHDGDWENSKVKAALKFMSKKVGDIRKKAYGVAGSRSSSNLSSSSSSNLKRRSVALASHGASSPSALSSSSGSVGSPNGPVTPRRSMQLTGINADDPRLRMFEAHDDDSNMRVSPETESVLAGTIEKLVQRLTHDSMPDPDFVLHFLTTHKCFTTSGQLLELLCLRWDTAGPADQDPVSFETIRLPSIRLRVYNVLKTWMERFWSDFQSDPELMDRLKIFAAAMYHGGLSSASQTLTKLIQKNLANEALIVQLPEPPQVFDFVRRSRRETPIALPALSNAPQVDVAYGNTTPRSNAAPMPAILTSLSTSLPRPLTILDFHPVELARQLSFMEYELWRQVKNVELLDVAWTRKDKETRSPNVLNMIRFSNHITNWMISEILTPDDPRERSVVLNRCIWMVKALTELRNFNGCMEALSAFHSSPIYRLKATWNLLPGSSWALYESLEKLMSPDANFKTYRNEYDRSVPPFTPYLGTHLSDLLFLEETLPRFLEGTQLINFAKMEKTSQFIQTLELSQQLPYSFTPIPLIMSYIKDFTSMTPKDAYNRSLAVEARKQKNRPNSTYHSSRVSSTAAQSETSLTSPKEAAPGST